jgi:O-antigen ligase
MVLSLLASYYELADLPAAKLLLSIQFLAPMLALLVGEYFGSVTSEEDGQLIARSFFTVLLITVPAQLVYTFRQGLGYLSPSLGLFSVYQYLQYVPVIYVAAYFVALFTLWDKRGFKLPLVFLSIAMGLYVSASISMTAMGMFAIGLALFAAYYFKFGRQLLPAALMIVSLLVAVAHFQYSKELLQFKFGPVNTSSQQGPAGESQNSGSMVPQNLTERYKIWGYYLDNISNNPGILIFGASRPPERSVVASAHNYFLDFIYNFGLIAIMPVLIIIGFTVWQIYIQRKRLLYFPYLSGLCFVVIFLIIADNGLKVSLRQPYTGIFTFFLWGLLFGSLLKGRFALSLICTWKNDSFSN